MSQHPNELNGKAINVLTLMHKARLLTREVDRLEVNCLEVENLRQLAIIKSARAQVHKQLEKIRTRLSFDRHMAIVRVFNAECDVLDAQQNKYGIRYRLELEIDAGNIEKGKDPGVYRIYSPVRGAACRSYLNASFDDLVLQSLLLASPVQVLANNYTHGFIEVHINEPLAGKIDSALEIAATNREGEN